MATLEEYLREFKDFYPVWMEKDRIAFLSTRSGYIQIWEKNLASGAIRQRTFFKSTVMRLCADPGSRRLLFTLDLNGSENGQIFILGYDEEEPKLILNRTQYLHETLGLGENGKIVYYLSNARNGIDSDLCKYDTETGAETVLYCMTKPNAQACNVSPNGRYAVYHLLSSYEDDRLYCFDLYTNTMKKIPDDDNISSEGNPCWSSDSRYVYLVTSRGSDLPYAARYEIETDELLPVYRTVSGECRCAAPSPDGKYLAVTVEEEGYAHIDLLNGEDYSFIRRIEPLKASMGMVGVGREEAYWSGDGRRILFHLTNGSHPCRLWSYDVETDSAEQMTDGGIVRREDLVDMELCEYHSFDGLRIPYFLYRPKGMENAVHMPVLLEIHGGPECQRVCEYEDYLQYYVSRGIAVVAPNVRGSSGYGRTYCHMDDREKRLDTIRDIEYLVKHIVETGIADPKRIAVSGISYGGFMTLSCVARLPELWACAVDRVGMYNLKTFIENTSPYRRAWRASEYGTLEDGDLLYNISPAAKAEQMKTPMIVIHGNNDPRVPISETEQLVSMLRGKGVEVEFIRYPDEGHEVKKFPNILDSVTKITEFVFRHLNRE